MLTKNFSAAKFIELTPSAVPTILAYDRTAGSFVVGHQARRIASGPRPVVQDFKLTIAESDAMFEGRFVSVKGARPQRTWEVRPEGPEKDQWVSTKDAVKLFLQRFFSEFPRLPEQLIVGVPATKNESWLKQYRIHMSQILAELGYPEPQFFPEPFAVFQYYRHVERLIPASGQPLAVLVIDFGGGTLDSCVIETTLEGNLARGGSASVPIGIQSVIGAGKAIDRRLVSRAISKINDQRLKQESPETRLAARPWVILAAEELKIALCEQMQHCRLEDDCRNFRAEAAYPAGWYHPDVPVRLELTGEDLKAVIRDLWFSTQGFGKSIINTVKEAIHRRGRGERLEKLDKVIIAGGSSGLPFLRELVERTLAGQISVCPEDIVIGGNCDKAVAYGIAIEAAEERNRSLKTHYSIGSCIFSELYLYSAPRRREAPVKPSVALTSGVKKPVDFTPGTLLPGLMRIGDYEAEYNIELPFRPHGTLFYWFTDQSQTGDPESERFNVEQDAIRVPPKTGTRFKLKIQFDHARGMVTPTFTFDGETLGGKPFLFGGLRFAKDVHSFAGVDFGTSNSYAVTLWASPKERETEYPTFSLSQQAGDRLRTLEMRLKELRTAGLLSREVAIRISNEELPDFIFHSIKIEGSTLSRGQTDALLQGTAVVTGKSAQEPLNVRDAYKFAVEHSDYLDKAPGSLVREINKLVLRDIDGRGGELRTTPVALSGMDFTPPDATDLSVMMDRLYEELRTGPENKSVIQFAAEMHSKLTAIHPFVDGNGRTARLLMNAILVNSGVPAVVINHTDKVRYLDCLAASNHGDISEFCILLAESVESSLEILKGNVGDPAAVEAINPKPLTKWVPSQELAELMEKRLSRLPVDRKARYEAWAAAFDALREELRSICIGFTELYGHALYKFQFGRYDSLPFQKYEALLRRVPASRTWLMTMDISSDKSSERFVFYFKHVSPLFRKTALRQQNLKQLPPSDVTLSISRRISGVYQPLAAEPIRLREIASFAGDWYCLTLEPDGTYLVSAVSLSTTLNSFIKDIVATFL